MGLLLLGGAMMGLSVFIAQPTRTLVKKVINCVFTCTGTGLIQKVISFGQIHSEAAGRMAENQKH